MRQRKHEAERASKNSGSQPWLYVTTTSRAFKGIAAQPHPLQDFDLTGPAEGPGINIFMKCHR